MAVHVGWRFSLLCCFSVFVNTEAQNKLLVSTPKGSFKGSTISDHGGNDYLAFRGIPYAKPPVGELRFAKPQPLDTIDGTFDATKEGPTCPHPSIYKFRLANKTVSEDCLILNVFAKDLNSNVPKKVMVFIHGGGYVVGSSTNFYPGTFVTNNDIIVVTLNYRLGIFGFLSLEDTSCPGNFALWDMTLALRWVKENIASFGGDPDDVTISGESAGGSAVGYLTISPYTKHLFTKAYPQSGTPTSTFGLSLSPRRDVIKLARNLNCYSDDNTELSSEDIARITQCLRQRPVTDFTESFNGFTPNNSEFVPIVDNDFLPGSPYQLLNDHSYLEKIGFYDRSYLVGINNNEASIMKSVFDRIFAAIRQKQSQSNDDNEKMIDYLRSSTFTFYVKSRIGQSAPSHLQDEIVDWYDRRFGNEALAQLTSDANFLLPTFDFLDAAARSDSTKVWLFHLNHFPRFMKGEIKGSIHALDLIYYFDLSVERLESMLQAGMDGTLGMAEEDYRLRKLFRSLLADFVKNGSVSQSAAAKELGASMWPEYTVHGGHYLDLKPRSQVRTALGWEVRQLWEHVANQRRKETSKHEEL